MLLLHGFLLLLNAIDIAVVFADDKDGNTGLAAFAYSVKSAGHSDGRRSTRGGDRYPVRRLVLLGRSVNSCARALRGCARILGVVMMVGSGFAFVALCGDDGRRGLATDEGGHVDSWAERGVCAVVTRTETKF